MQVQRRQLRLVEGTGAAAKGDLAQGRDTALLVALEMVAHRVGVDLQHLGHLLGAPTGAQEHHRLDAVGFALVAGLAMRSPQLREPVSAEGVVVHAG